MATPVDIQKITLSDGDHEILAKAAKALTMPNGSIGTEQKPVFFDTDGRPQSCNFVISSGTLANRPSTGVNGQIYFVI